MAEDRCVCCGEIIPEGRQVCPNCEHKDVCAKFKATGGVKRCDHFKEMPKKGKWIAVPSSDMMTGKAYKCSECNKMRYGSFMPNYCQNCGADMRGTEDGK